MLATQCFYLNRTEGCISGITAFVASNPITPFIQVQGCISRNFQDTVLRSLYDLAATVNKNVLFKALCVVAVSRGWWTPNLKLSELTRDCFIHLAFPEYVPQETLQCKAKAFKRDYIFSDLVQKRKTMVFVRFPLMRKI
ncbi:hypothetical protein AVEN_133209-1 [Araneus ventricosus]|uniref:Uncharacterized protein n=1 Tax=Araneus ventricosus TaxID=182803 RepID=A0A4Y2X5Y3_ARAVE|nr:hypothetical protein AVEN_133209-1 [Araneus ventricosus]